MSTTSKKNYQKYQHMEAEQHALNNQRITEEIKKEIKNA